MFKFIFHSDYLVAIDYNERDDILIIGSHDKSIKLWDCKLETVKINKE